ncbi:neutral zinc metallopeptidase [Kribbella deserti]|uniref:Neutral zinc metallopeptidase n=1 Tax=Kribbella deserti TaxID=1926257 RepID=A0ABV6QH58_9ACTN
MTKFASPTTTARSTRSTAKRGLLALLAVSTASAVVALTGVQSAAAHGPDVPAPVSPSVTGEHAEPKMVSTGPGTASAASSYNIVRYNKLYQTGRLGASKCKMPAYPLTTAGNVKAYHLSFLYCLNNVWVGKIRAAGKTFTKPTLVVHEKGVNSACGFIPANNAYYCSGSRGIYIPWKRYLNMWKNNGAGYARAYAMQIIAHEYGHHVQAMTGILQASHYRQVYVHKTSAKKLEENRRMELQASCFSAAYLGADRAYFPMTGSIYTNWRWMVANMGDDAVAGGPRDHGSKSSHNWWSLRGYNNMTSASCNTWTGASSIVD